MAAWTLTDLADLEKALAQGALKVKYRDREVTYRSVSEMLQLRGVMQRDLGVHAKSNGRKVVSISKGTT